MSSLSIDARFTYVRLHEWYCIFIHKEHSTKLIKLEAEVITCFLYAGFSLGIIKLAHD